MSRDKTYLMDILRAAQAIRRFVDGVTKEAFLANEEKYEAVNRKFEIMGEAAHRLSPKGGRSSRTFRGSSSRLCATSSSTTTTT